MAMNTPYYLNDIKTIEVSKIREIPLFSLSSMVAETSKDGYNEEHFQKSGRDPHD